MWSRVKLTKIQTTTRPDHVWPEVWTKIGKAAQNREKQECAKENSKLDKARRLRRIYFIDPDDEEYKDIVTIAREKLERDLWHQPCFVKRPPKGITKCAESDIAYETTPKTLYGCKVESHESTRQLVDASQQKKS